MDKFNPRLGFNGRKVNILSPDSLVLIEEYKPYTLFYVFCTEEYAIRYGESAEEALKRSIENPQVIAGLSPNCVVLSSAPWHAAKVQSDFARALRLSIGDIVRIAGRLYEIETAANDNLFLRPIPQKGVKFYGHPRKNPYPNRFWKKRATA